jgi:LruC domain-containing protein
MNDLVVKYRYSYINNSSNKVVDMAGDFVVDNAIASFTNGLGIQLPIAPGLISNVTGQRLADNYISVNANNTEAGQAKAVIIPFDNHKTLMNNAGSMNGAKDTVKVKFSFTSPLSISALLGAPYNPFLISNKTRGVEVHLAGYLPTDKANLGLFGTQHDNTIPANNKYYLSSENWPWALSFTEAFSYPKEGAAINEAYLHFGEWATSGGTIYTDWYQNTAAGYRVVSKIY